MRGKSRMPLEALQPYLLGRSSATIDSQYFDWRGIFPADQPLEIEVGFGKGGWLIEAAHARPHHNFLGIEVVRALQLYVATRAAKRLLNNVRLACADARHFLSNWVAPGTVSAIHVYFPDPWWKQRHKKRRVFTPEFAAASERTLQLGGQLLIGTDVEEYFGVMTQIVAQRSGFRETHRGVQSGPAEPTELLTNFERKARQKGGSVWRAAYVRVETPDQPNG